MVLNYLQYIRIPIALSTQDTRLSFVASRRYTSSFSLATFSNKGQTFTMIDPPKEVFRQTYLPRQTSRYDTITKELSTLSLVGESPQP